MLHKKARTVQDLVTMSASSVGSGNLAQYRVVENLFTEEELRRIRQTAFAVVHKKKKVTWPGVDGFEVEARALPLTNKLSKTISPFVSAVHDRNSEWVVGNKYDFRLMALGQQAITRAGGMTFKSTLDRYIEHFKDKEAGCTHAHWGIIVTLPHAKRMNQTWHRDAAGTPCYATLLIPLTNDDSTVHPADGLPKAGGTEIKKPDSNVPIQANPYLGMTIFDGEVEHRGLGNVSDATRTFLYITITGRREANS